MTETIRFHATVRTVFPLTRRKYLSGFGQDAQFEILPDGFGVSFSDSNMMLQLEHRPDWSVGDVIEFTAKVKE